MTANLPADLLTEAMQVTGRGITDTLIAGLDLVRRARAREKAMALRGRIRVRVDLDGSRERRRRVRADRARVAPGRQVGLTR